MAEPMIVIGGLTIFSGYLYKYFLKAFANISINLRDLNMKH